MLALRKTLLYGRLPALPAAAAAAPSRISSLLRLLSSSSSFPGGGGGGDDWGGSSFTGGGGGGGGDEWGSTWSTGLTKDHFDGSSPSVGRPVPSPSAPISRQQAIARDMDEVEGMVRDMERESKTYADSWDDRMQQTCALLKQVREPGARGSYLKDSEKQEMYRLHKEDPATYTVERLAKDFRVMRQRVHAILWLKEMEEEEERKRGEPLDDSIEILLDSCPEFFNSHDREFHVASLPYKPDFKVMPEGWDGTTQDPDEVLYEISMKEDQKLYEEFVQRLEFNKKKVAGEVKCHKYSRRRPDDGWSYMVEKLGPQGKRGAGGGWKFISLPDGSSRPLNDMEKMYVKRETQKRRRRIIAPYK
ncbi:hypothetical protein U9M48_017419 [Paspalum notatum var. saurae]|uniref:Uncharacterized protein n=1 Tax=Paspalum notatum var. saurae TaxID=547442 RepID=A0AAQ3WP75_PASNO